MDEQEIGAVSCRRSRRGMKIVCATGTAAETGMGTAARIGRVWETGMECRAEGEIGEWSAAEEAGAAVWMKTEGAVGSSLERRACGGQGPGEGVEQDVDDGGG